MPTLPPDMNDKLAQLKLRYVQTFADKRGEFEAAYASYQGGDAEGLTQLRHHAHKLAGSGASYGFAILGQLARRLENAAIARLEGSVTSDIEGPFRSLIDELNTEIDRHG